MAQKINPATGRPWTQQELAYLTMVENQQRSGTYNPALHERYLTTVNTPMAGTQQTPYVEGVDPIDVAGGLDTLRTHADIQAQVEADKRARERIATERGIALGSIDGTPTLESVQYANSILASPQNAALYEMQRRGYALGPQAGETVSQYLNRTLEGQNAGAPGTVSTPTPPTAGVPPVGTAPATPTQPVAGNTGTTQNPLLSRLRSSVPQADLDRTSAVQKSLEGNMTPEERSFRASGITSEMGGDENAARWTYLDRVYNQRTPEGASRADTKRVNYGQAYYQNTNETAGDFKKRMDMMSAQEQRAADKKAGIYTNKRTGQTFNFSGLKKRKKIGGYRFGDELDAKTFKPTGTIAPPPIVPATPYTPTGYIAAENTPYLGGLGGEFNQFLLKWRQNEGAVKPGDTQEALKAFSGSMNKLDTSRDAAKRIQLKVLGGADLNDPQSRDEIASVMEQLVDYGNIQDMNRYRQGRFAPEELSKLRTDIEGLGLEDEQLAGTLSGYGTNWARNAELANPEYFRAQPQEQTTEQQLMHPQTSAGSKKPTTATKTQEQAKTDLEKYDKNNDKKLDANERNRMKVDKRRQKLKSPLKAAARVGGATLDYMFGKEDGPPDSTGYMPNGERIFKDEYYEADGSLNNALLNEAINEKGREFVFRADGGGVTIGGKQHFIVDENGKIVAALTEDDLPEHVRGQGGVEVIPMTEPRHSMYKMRKANGNVPGFADGGGLNLYGTTGNSQRTAPSRRPGGAAFNTNRTMSGNRIDIGNMKAKRRNIFDGRATNGQTNNGRWKLPSSDVRIGELPTTDADARSIMKPSTGLYTPPSGVGMTPPPAPVTGLERPPVGVRNDMLKTAPPGTHAGGLVNNIIDYFGSSASDAPGGFDKNGDGTIDLSDALDVFEANKKPIMSTRQPQLSPATPGPNTVPYIGLNTPLPRPTMATGLYTPPSGVTMLPAPRNGEILRRPQQQVAGFATGGFLSSANRRRRRGSNNTAINNAPDNPSVQVNAGQGQGQGQGQGNNQQATVVAPPVVEVPVVVDPNGRRFIGSGGPGIIGNQVGGARFGFDRNAPRDIAANSGRRNIVNDQGVSILQPWKFAPRTLRNLGESGRAMLQSYWNASGGAPDELFGRSQYGMPRVASSSRVYS